MYRCLDLARRGEGMVSPNPLVGAVLVYRNRIIGEGWHQQYGQAHAEVNCIRSVAEAHKKWLSKSTLYVSLEPCNHFGQTPPCSDLIIKHKIPKVVIGCIDTFSLVGGRGVGKMLDAGIKVKVGVLEQACRYLNRRFFSRQERNRPYIILKWAESADGYLAPDSKAPYFISDWMEQRHVHRQRAEEDAVLVGYRTAKLDNPRLDNRYWLQRKQPLRILVDFKNNLNRSAHLLDGQQKTMVFNLHKEGQDGLIQWVKLKGKESLPQQIIEQLPGINSLIVEGGRQTIRMFIEQGIWDEAFRWVNQTTLLQQGLEAPVLTQAVEMQQIRLGQDLLFRYRHK